MVHAAYTAKAGVDSDPWPWYEPPGWDVYPDGGGWDPDWPFPGPNPPGYEPESPRYGCSISGSDEIQVGESYSATFRLHENYDSSKFRTQEPLSGTITWTAVLNGQPLRLNVDGSGLAYSIETSFEAAGSDWWGDSASIQFEIDEDDEGKIIGLSASAVGTIGSSLNPDSFDVSDAKSIEVVSPQIASMEFDITLNDAVYDAGTASPEMKIKVQRLSLYDWPQFGGFNSGSGWTWWNDDTTFNTLDECESSASNSNTNAVISSPTDDSFYLITMFAGDVGGCTLTATLTATVTFDDKSTKQEQEQVVITPFGDDETRYVFVNTSTEVVQFSGWS